MIEFLLENLFSMVADLSIEKIADLRKQYTNQKILYLTAEQYVNAEYFRSEYRDVIPVLEKDRILAIDSRDIEPSKSIQELCDNIKPVFDSMLITDKDTLKQDIITAIATQYRSKRELAISLFDILEQQKKDTDAILEKISTVDNQTLLITDSIQKREALKERAIRSGIGRKMEQLIYYAAQSFISIVTKKPAQSVGDAGTELEQILDCIRKQLEDDFPEIGIDFLLKPVSIIMPNPDGSIIPLQKEIETLQFLNLLSRQIQEHIDELLKYTALLPDDFIIKMIELGNVIDSNLYSHAIERGIAPMLRNAIPTDKKAYVDGFKKYYRELGMKILSMEHYTKSR